jgi:hypothetical protein
MTFCRHCFREGVRVFAIDQRRVLAFCGYACRWMWMKGWIEVWA